MDPYGYRCGRANFTSNCYGRGTAAYQPEAPYDSTYLPFVAVSYHFERSLLNFAWADGLRYTMWPEG